MSYLTRDAILAAADLVREEVDVPEWGGKVLISAMSGTDRDAFERTIIADKSKDAAQANFRALLVAFTAVDEQGTRLFTLADVEALGRKSSPALTRCALVAQRINGLAPDAVEQAKGN